MDQEKFGPNKFKSIKTDYSLKEFVRIAVSDYFFVHVNKVKNETKKTYLRDFRIRYFYDQLEKYVREMPKDPLESLEGKCTYKKKVIAVYLAHLISPIDIITRMDKITHEKLFKISNNAFKKQ